jgi:hypothetical protein
MFMGENIPISQRTKHVDIRAKFVTEMILDGFLRVIFVRSEENDADLCTKNLPNEAHHNHSGKMIRRKQEE